MENFDKNRPSTFFIEKLTQIILDNLSNEQFSVESLAQSYGISRSQLFKKIKSATGKSASQFIREVRLVEAQRLIISTDLTIAEISYQVGFNSPTYFSSSYKQYFGYSPNEANIRNEFSNEDESESSIKNNQTVNSNADTTGSIKKRKWLIYSMAAVLLILLSTLWYSKFSKHKIKNAKSIAVLRFINMTESESNTYFADGLAEEILNSLAKIGELQVVARTSSFKYDKNDDITEIGQKLKANYILEGSVRSHNNKVRVTIQLIDAVNDGYHIWSETYDREKKDILFLQEEIARSVVHELEIQLTSKEDVYLSKRITTDSTAYTFYTKGLRYANSGKISDLKKGIELIEMAIASDSTFALAHARIVDLYRQYNFVGDLDWDETTKIMQEHVDKAFVFDPTLAEVYIAKGYLESRKENYSEAMNSFETAVELAPNEPRAHFALAGTYIVFNRVTERYSELEKAYELDPLNPRISLMAAQYFYYHKGDFYKGINTLENSISAFPENDLAKCHLAMYKSSLPDGDLTGAFKIYFEMYKKTPDQRRALNWLAHCTYWLDLKPMSEMLNNKMRLMYPTNIHTFWNMYANNALHGRYSENIDLVKFWSKDQNLSLYDQVNYLAESYINSNKPELAIQIIEDSFSGVKEPSFLIDAEKYNSLKNVRLDILEKYIIAQRNLNKIENTHQIVKLAINFIDNELNTLLKDQIIDYRYELYLKLVRASINDDVDQLIKVFGEAFFEDKHRTWMYDELLTLARYNRFRNLSKFKGFVSRIEHGIRIQRTEVITYLKAEGFWESTWDTTL